MHPGSAQQKTKRTTEDKARSQRFDVNARPTSGSLAGFATCRVSTVLRHSVNHRSHTSQQGIENLADINARDAGRRRHA